ncbi:MAG: hypothetical protein CW716_03880 [Candidatus Bathyarchaeum sp.]|nr:MAG: hypothetical protein CW716_03880 [Candidatus Bathyarchaeum sp.]
MDATNKWWGTKNDTLISEKIYDYYDDYILGTVTFIPFLTEPNTETIPEFQSCIVLTLLLSATLLLIVYKRRYLNPANN